MLKCILDVKVFLKFLLDEDYLWHSSKSETKYPTLLPPANGSLGQGGIVP